MNLLHYCRTPLIPPFPVQGQIAQATARSTLVGPVPGELSQVNFKVPHIHSPGNGRKGLFVPRCL